MTITKATEFLGIYTDRPLLHDIKWGVMGKHS
jgi:hypothetical protein